MSVAFPASIENRAATLGERHIATAPRMATWLAVVYAVLTPVLVLPISQNEFAGAVDLLAPLCVAVVLLGGQLARLRLVHVMMLALWAAALLSLLPIRDPALAQSCLLRWVRLVALGAPLFLSLACEAPGALARRVLKAFAWGGFVAIALGLVVYWLQIPIRPDQQQLWFEGSTEPIFRAGGLAGNTGLFGHLVATWAVLTLGISCEIVSAARRRMTMLAVLGLAIYAIWVCSSRSALLNVLVSCVCGWFLLNDSRQRWAAVGDALKTVILGTVLLALPAGLWLVRESEPLQTSLARFLPGQRSGIDDYASGRLRNWSLYLGEVESHPWLGAGYKSGYRKFHEQAPDNSAISMLYETGLLGLVAGAGLVLAIVVPLCARGSRGDPLARLLAAAWIGQLAHGMTADIYTFWLAMPVLYLVTGLVLSAPEEATAA